MIVDCLYCMIEETDMWVRTKKGKSLKIEPEPARQRSTTPNTSCCICYYDKEIWCPYIVVTGTIPILGYFTYALFNSGFTHSFISKEFNRQAKLELEPLEISRMISAPTRINLLPTQKVNVDMVFILRRDLKVTLIVLNMNDFESSKVWTV